NIGSSVKGPGTTGRRADRDICTVPRFTTAGRTRSATWTNADWSASAVVKGAGADRDEALTDFAHNAWTSNPTATHRRSVTARKPARAVRGVIDKSTAVASNAVGFYGSRHASATNDI